MFHNFVNYHNLPIAGRLKHFLPAWEQVTKDPWVLQVTQGYLIEFMTKPAQTRTPISMFTTQENQNLIDQEVQELLAKQAVHPASPSSQHEQGFISSLFVVPKKGEGHQPVINLKPLNMFLPYEHFKMESINMLKDLLRKDDYLVKIDLKDAYLTIPIWKGHQKYLRFLYLLEFACLPFGLTKLMKPVLSILRQSGVRLVAYLDDFLIMGETRQLTLQHAATTLNLLEGLGFVVNYPKSVLIPSQEIEFLGFIVNSLNLSLSLPTDKIKKVRQNCQRLLDNPVVTVWELAKFLGLLSASIQAVFPAPLNYRYLQHAKNSVLKKNPKILRSPCHSRPKGPSGSALVEGQPSCLEWKGPSPSTYRPYHQDRCLPQRMPGVTSRVPDCQVFYQAQVLLLMDNVTAVTYINKMGGPHSLLSQLAKDLWDRCLNHNVLLRAQCLPGIQNVQADRESRVFLDSSDWKLNTTIFDHLYQKWGPLNLDLFASRLTFQLDQYVSWRPDPLAIHTDAFTLNWATFRGYAFPPFALIGRCLQQVQSQRVEHLVLVAPVWPAQTWYPLLLELCVDFPLLLPMQTDLC